MFEINELIKEGIKKGIDQTELLTTLSECMDHNKTNIETFEKLYRMIHGDNLCDRFCLKMVDCMHHDGEKGKKWTVEQTDEIARKIGISFNSDTYTHYEFWTVFHLKYYDHHKSMEEMGNLDLMLIGKFADDYLDDEDAPKGKLVNYFFFLEKNKEGML